MEVENAKNSLKTTIFGPRAVPTAKYTKSTKSTKGTKKGMLQSTASILGEPREKHEKGVAMACYYVTIMVMYKHEDILEATLPHPVRIQGQRPDHRAGRVVPIDALARPFGLVEKIRALAALDPRKRKGSGFAPEAIATQVAYALCSGGTSLSDVEQMGKDPAWRIHNYGHLTLPHWVGK